MWKIDFKKQINLNREREIGREEDLIKLKIFKENMVMTRRGKSH